MVTRPARPLSLLLDEICRWRWWLSAILTALAAFIFHTFDGDADPVSWVFFLLFAVLWMAVLVRWSRAARDAGKASREGLKVTDGSWNVPTSRIVANVSTGAMRDDRPVNVSSTPEPEHPGILAAWDGKAWIGPDGLRPEHPNEDDEKGG
jgi:Ca2+/Na+ antiporter